MNIDHSRLGHVNVFANAAVHAQCDCGHRTIAFEARHDGGYEGEPSQGQCLIPDGRTQVNLATYLVSRIVDATTFDGKLATVTVVVSPSTRDLGMPRIFEMSVGGREYSPLFTASREVAMHANFCDGTTPDEGGWSRLVGRNENSEQSLVIGSYRFPDHECRVTLTGTHHDDFGMLVGIAINHAGTTRLVLADAHGLDEGDAIFDIREDERVLLVGLMQFSADPEMIEHAPDRQVSSVQCWVADADDCGVDAVSTAVLTVYGVVPYRPVPRTGDVFEAFARALGINPDAVTEIDEGYKPR